MEVRLSAITLCGTLIVSEDWYAQQRINASRRSYHLRYSSIPGSSYSIPFISSIMGFYSGSCFSALLARKRCVSGFVVLMRMADRRGR